MRAPLSLPAPIPGVATFSTDPAGLLLLELTTELATATLSADGAHVMRFQPRGAEPVLFMSGSSFLTPGKPIRGGIPVCFPWFSARAGHPASPAHGFARLSRWTVRALSGSASAGVTVDFTLEAEEATRAHWPHDFTARLRVELTRELRVTLAVTNTGGAPLTYEDALHTYFAVADIHHVTVTGLEGAPYLDKLQGGARLHLGPEPLSFTGETDRIFPGHTATCVIHDPGLARRIIVEKSGSRSTVVWNPWSTKAAAMPDFGDHEWPGMLCIETANVGADALTLAPGESHATTALIRLG